MKLITGVPIMNQQQVTQEFLKTLRENQTGECPLILVDNGSKPPLREWLIGLNEQDIVIRNEENEGLVTALNQIWHVARDLQADYIFYTHNDVMVYESGWDDKIKRLIAEENKKAEILGHIGKVGVAGFYGAKGIGTRDIYKTPYLMQQMIRIENVSNCNRMDANHGYRNIRGGAETEDVAVMDGFSLIVSMELLNKLGGFDRNYPPHHMYDNDICMESLNSGYRNIVIAMDAQHLGGRTDVGEDWASRFGKTKQQIHQEAHPVFYEKWRPKPEHKVSLPIYIT